jgi:transcriptional regulator with XRE-family HTH domain
VETLDTLRAAIVARRKTLRMRQGDLAARAQVSVPTIKALEQGRMGELGFSKLVRILATLGLELKLQEAGQGRPTLDDLRSEDGDD